MSRRLPATWVLCVWLALAMFFLLCVPTFEGPQWIWRVYGFGGATDLPAGVAPEWPKIIWREVFLFVVAETAVIYLDRDTAWFKASKGSLQRAAARWWPCIAGFVFVAPLIWVPCTHHFRRFSSTDYQWLWNADDINFALVLLEEAIIATVFTVARLQIRTLRVKQESQGS